MNIAVYHNQPSGGARRALYELCRRLSSRHSIDVFTLETADEKFLDSRDFARRVHVEPYQKRNPVRFGLYLNDLRQWLDLRDLQTVSRRVAGLIDDGGYDVVLVDACRFIQSPSVLRFLKTPNAYYCHEPPRRFVHAEARPDAAPLSLYERARYAWHWPGRILTDRTVAETDRLNVASAGAVLVNSEHSQDMIRAYYGRDPAIARLGVDTARFRPGSGAAGEYVLSVGALEPHKGFDFLIQALARCPAEHRPPLVIVGNTDDAGLGRTLSQEAEAAGVSIQIRVRVSDEELVELYQGARAFVYSPHHEPFGLTVLEAMACGLPVVSVDEGGPKESVIHGYTGFLVPRDAGAFAEALTTLLADGDVASRFGARGRQEAESRWTWDAAASRLEEHLASQTVAREVAKR